MKNKQTQIIKSLCPWYEQGKCTANPGVADKCDLTCNYGQTALSLLYDGFQQVEEDSIVLTRAELDTIRKVEREETIANILKEIRKFGGRGSVSEYHIGWDHAIDIVVKKLSKQFNNKD